MDACLWIMPAPRGLGLDADGTRTNPKKGAIDPLAQPHSCPTTAATTRIRPLAESAGMCRIIPPEGWAPPFTIDPATFKFPTRCVEGRVPRTMEAKAVG